MTTRFLRTVFALGSLAALSGCEGGASGRADSSLASIASVQWTDSTRLTEGDSVLANPLGGLAIGATGEFFVSDVATGQVMVFSSNGRLERRIGRRGRGPGEMLAPAVIELADGDQLLVLDNPNARINRFRLSDGEYLSAIRLLGPTADFRVRGAEVWMTTAQVATNTSLAYQPAGAETLRSTGQLPVEYTTYPRLLRAMGIGVLALSGNDVWVGMQGTNSVERYATTSPASPIATVEIPRVRRRGVPLDNPTALKEEVSYEDEVGSTSLLFALGALDDGRVATVHLDATLSESGLTVVAYLSAVDAATGKGCVDLALPIEGSAIPVLRFAGNWLYLVEATVQSDDTSLTWVRRLDVGSLKCEG